MGELTRNYDWSTTSVGTPDCWPQSLRTTVSIILNAQFPMLLFWGPELIQFYNDAFRPSMGREGGKHPAALGNPGADTWSEVWLTVNTLICRVLTGEECTWRENQLIPIDRNGQLEEVYWTFSYSPVLDDGGQIAGVLVVCQETTRQVIAQQQLEQSEDRFRRLIEQAPVAVAFFSGPRFVITLANERVLEYWGRSREQVIDKPLFAALPEASGQGFEELLHRVYITGERLVANELTVNCGHH
jgi:PAS domain-containing protein